jgi:hypothetical protein
LESIGSCLAEKQESKSDRVNEYVNRIKASNIIITEVDDDIFNGVIERITVFDTTLEFKLKCRDKTIICKRIER